MRMSVYGTKLPFSDVRSLVAMRVKRTWAGQRESDAIGSPSRWGLFSRGFDQQTWPALKNGESSGRDGQTAAELSATRPESTRWRSGRGSQWIVNGQKLKSI